MSKLSRCVSTTAGATGNEQHDSCRSPFSVLRGTIHGGPVEDAPAFYTSSCACLALQSTALYFLMIVIAMMGMVNPAHANGIVTKPPGTNFLATTSFVVYNPPATIAGGNAAKHACDYRFTTHNAFGACMLSQTAEGAYYAPIQSAIHGAVYTYKLPNHGQYKFNYTWNNASICPVNSTGSTTCTCNDGYEPDPAATSCIPEQYTVSLSGLGGDVMPTKTRDAYAHVAKNDGSNKSGAQVTLELTVVPEDDGLLYSAHVGSVSPNGGSTGADGRLSFEFKAPTAGGLHTITASCANCTNQATGTIKVPGCGVPELRKVEDIPPNESDVLPLTLELDRTRGAGLALLPDAQAGVSCIKVKEPGTVITGGTRTLAYQAHLKEIWDKSIELDLPDNKNNAACQPLRDKVNAEKGCSGGHCITYPPATDSNHPKGTAFDVSRETIRGLLGRLRPPPPLPPKLPLTPAQQNQADIKLMADWLASPVACNLGKV